MPEQDRYSVVIRWSDEDEGFVARMPEFPNLYAFGSCREEALAQARDAMWGYLDLCKSEGVDRPAPDTWENHDA